MRKYLPWILLLTLLFPIINLLIYFLRFGAPGSNLFLESLVFAPIGLLGALVLFYFYDRADTRIQKNAIIVGFLLAFPFALLGGLMGGLLGVPATILFGALPLIIGVLFGNWAGRMLAQSQVKDE
jgi:hypothetical protein